MRRIAVGVAAVALGLGALAVWRSPTTTLVRLKLALDRRDLTAVIAALDRRALTDAALARLVDGRPEEPADIRLVLRGESAWVPAVSSARAYLRMRLERTLERLVEDPERALEVSWEDLRRALATLRRSGSVARFRIPGRNGEEYVVRMRRAGWRWRIVAVDRDGEPLLIAPAERDAVPAVVRNGYHPDEQAPAAAMGEALGAHLAPLVAEAPVDVPPRPVPRTGPRAPFVRRLADGAWTVQVSSMVDALDAELEREWIASLGEPAFVVEADVRGQTWRRVLVGRYATSAEAERTIARLTGQPSGEPGAVP
jgi:hypothetical protein